MNNFSLTSTTNKLIAWLEKISHSSPSDIVRSILLMTLILVVRAILLRLLARSSNLSLETKRQWALTLRNLAFIIGLIGLIVIWSQEIRTLALSMVAVAVALVLTFKELITCLMSAFLRTLSNSYKLGDYIQVGRFKGRVVDINLMSTTLMEMGPDNVFQFTGHAVIFHNSMLFLEPVERLDYTGDYIAHTISIPVPYEFPVAYAKAPLMAIADEVCARHLEPARRYMAKMEARHLADTPSVEPRFAIAPFDEKFYRLIVRVVLPQGEQHDAEQEILFRFMSQIPNILSAAQNPSVAPPSVSPPSLNG